MPRMCAIYSAYIKKLLYSEQGIWCENSKILVEYDSFAGYVDNDVNKQKNGFEEEKVYSPEELKDVQALTVISVGVEYRDEVKDQLTDMGLHEYIDFITIEEFETKWFPVLSYYYFGKLYMNFAQISVTERYTLRCKKCAHACHVVNIHSEDMSLSDAKLNADYFFEHLIWWGNLC